MIWLRCHLVCFPLFLFLTWLSSEALPPALLRGVSELEHVNKHSLDHCIERHTHARCTGSNGVGCGGPVLFLFFKIIFNYFIWRLDHKKFLVELI